MEDFKSGQVILLKTLEELREQNIEIKRSLKEFLGREFFVLNINESILEEKSLNLKDLEGNILCDRYGWKYKLPIDYISDKAPKTIQPHIGQELTFLHLKLYKKYGGLICTSYMTSFANKKVKIKKINEGLIQIEGDELGKWFSTGMFKEYNLHPEYNVGDKVNIKSYFTSTDFLEDFYVSNSMRNHFDKIATITDVRVRNGVRFYYLDIDHQENQWIVELFDTNYKSKNLKFNDIINDNLPISIKCFTHKQMVSLLIILNSLGFKNNDGSDITFNTPFPSSTLNILKDKKIEYLCCQEEDQAIEIIHYSEIVFDEEIMNVVKKYIFKEDLQNRGILIGDIYYVDSEDDEHKGWRLALNGYSVGLDTKNNKSWSTLDQDINLKITNILLIDTKLEFFSNISEFFDKFDENLIIEYCKKVIK